MNEDLTALREKLDEVDGALVPLLLRRMEIVARVAAYKKEKGIAVRDAGREQEILERVQKQAGEEFSPYIRVIYQKILEMSRAYQETRLDRHED